MPAQFLTEQEAAALLGVHRSRVWQMVNAGQLKLHPVKVEVERFSRTEVLALKRRKRGPGRPRKA